MRATSVTSVNIRVRYTPPKLKGIFLKYQPLTGPLKVIVAFMREYPSSKFARRANGILFHLVSDDQKDEVFPHEQNSDSLNAVIESTRGYLVPFLHEGRFGFMNQHGEEVINAQAEEIDKQYRCGNLSDDVIALPHKLVSNQRYHYLWSGRGGD